MATKNASAVHLGEFIREHRKAMWWTQDELARRCGCCRSTIQTIERTGSTTCYSRTLFSIREALGISAKKFPVKLSGNEVSLTLSLPLALYKSLRDASISAGDSIDSLITQSLKNVFAEVH